jgi:hypothetical protein
MKNDVCHAYLGNNIVSNPKQSRKFLEIDCTCCIKKFMHKK